MNIKKGDKFLCIKDVIMQHTFTKEVVYNEGNVYTSEEDGCITNNKGNINHCWAGVEGVQSYFKPLKDVDRMYTKATDRLRELHRNFTGWKIGDPDNADYFDNKNVSHKYFAFSAQWGLEEFYKEEGYDYVSEEVFIELNGLEEKTYDEDLYNWVNNAMEKSVISNKKGDNVQNNDPINPTHYNQYAIQPLDYIEANGFDFCEGNVIKYVSRYKQKNGLEDLKKARVYLDKLINRYEK